MPQIKIANKMIEYTHMHPMTMNTGDTIYKYKGNSGVCYKYDLSKALDRQSYEMDLSAHLNDSIKIELGIDMDRRIGQYGGGIK